MHMKSVNFNYHQMTKCTMDQPKLAFNLVIVFLSIGACSSVIVSGSNTSATVVPQTDLQKIIDLFTREKQNLQSFVATHENQLSNKLNALEQDLNTTKTELSKVTAKLDKEKRDREQLQRDYDQLILDFYNVSVNYNSLVAEVQRNGARNAAVEAKETELERKNRELENNVNNISQALKGVDFAALTTDHADLVELKRKGGYNSGFTAWFPLTGLTTGTVKFSQVVSNIGGHYQASTGKFYCKHPGVYYFSLAIYKNYYTTSAYCYLRKNGLGMIYTSSTAASLSGSHSIIVHLNNGDVVDAGSCSSVTYMSIYSSFSGFLLKAD